MKKIISLLLGIALYFFSTLVAGLIALTFIPASATAQTTRIYAAVNLSDSFPAITADGRFIAWVGGTGDNVHVLDRSLNTFKVGGSYAVSPTISADGRYVAYFTSYSRSHCYLWDTQSTSGPTPQSLPIPDLSNPYLEADGSSYRCVISANGRFLAFVSDATNLVLGDTNGFRDVFVRDLESHVTELVSIASDGKQGNDNSAGPSANHIAISEDGRYVAFQSGEGSALDTGQKRISGFLWMFPSQVDSDPPIETDGWGIHFRRDITGNHHGNEHHLLKKINTRKEETFK